jgi:hypothetical protein
VPNTALSEDSDRPLANQPVLNNAYSAQQPTSNSYNNQWSQGNNAPQHNQGYQQQFQQNYPQQHPQQQGYPPQQGGYPPQQGGYPQQQGGYPQQQGYNGQQPNMPGQQPMPNLNQRK